MVDTKKEQERDELHRAIWAIADELRGAVDGWDFKNYVLGIKCTLCQVQKVCVLVNIAIFIWIMQLAALSYPFAYPAVGVKATAGEAEPMP